MKVLLIESDKHLAANLSTVLKNNCHKVVWRVDLQTALEDMDSGVPDAIIIDLLLAGRSGVEFLYELRSYPEWHNLPVIIWTDLDQNELRSLIAGLNNLGTINYHHKSTTRLKDLVQSLNFITAPA